MITARHIGIASVAGLVLGTAISVSPAGAAAIAAMGGLIWWVARPLHGVERRWVIGWLTLAAAARVAVVAALPLTVDPRQQSFSTVFGGDAFYMIQRSIGIANAFVHAPFAPRDFFEAFSATYGWSGYTYALALLHVFFGPSPYATHLLSVVIFLAAALVLFGYVRSSYGRIAAFIGIAALTTMPSLFVWSIAPLKEAPFGLLAAGAVCATLSLIQPRRWWHIPAGAIGVVTALSAIRSVRPEWAILTAAALATGAAGWVVFRHRLVAACAAAASVALALALLIGAAPRVSAFIADELASSSRRHMGNVFIQGHSYALLDPDAYASDGKMTSGPRSLARFVVRAPVRFFTVPEPWLLKPGFELLMVPQQMVWYALLALAGAGVLAGLRRDSLLTCVFAAFVLVGAVAIGLNSGNVGTLIRHRDAVVPFVIWLAALGGTRVIGSGSRRFNTLDAAVAAVPIVLIQVGYALYLLFHIPPPRIDVVEPTIVSTPGELVLHGEHLRPFLRAFVARGSRVRLLDRMGDSFPPEAPYFVRNGQEAMLRLPALPPATYDLGIFDGADEVAYVSGAFTVASTAADPVGAVQIDGRLTGVDETRARALVPGAALKSDDGTPVLEILRVGADRPQLASTGPGTWATWMRIEGQSERPATIRLRCRFVNNVCFFSGSRVVAGQDLSLSFPDFTVTFKMDVVVPDDARWPLRGEPTKDAIVDFIGWPGAQTHLAPGMRDAGSPFAPPVRPSEIVRIVAVEPFVGDATLEGVLDGERLFMQQPLVRIRAIVRYPLLPSGQVEQRGRPVSLGSRVDFETPDRLLRGTITSFVDAHEARHP